MGGGKKMSFLETLLDGVNVGAAQRREAQDAARLRAKAEEKHHRRAQRITNGDDEGDTDDDGSSRAHGHFRGWRQRKRARKGGGDASTAAVVASPGVVLERWHAIRREEYGMKAIDDGHMCTVTGCVDTGSIQCVDADLALYGCINSGRHHVCNVDRDCTQLYTTADGGVFCIFSRRFVETYVDTTRWGERMSEREIYMGAADPHDATQAKDGRKRRRDMIRSERRAARGAVGVNGEDGAPTRLRFGMAIQETQRDMTAVSEAIGVSARVLTGDCGGEDSRADGFIAINGTDEVDDTTAAMRARALLTDAATAASASLQFSAFAPDRAGKAYSSRAIVQAGGCQTRLWRAPREYFARYTRTDIDRIVGAVFDTAHRAKLHRRQADATRVVAYDAISRYYAACRGICVRPSAQECDVLYAEAVARVPQIEPVELGGERRVRYVAFLYELWRIAIATPYFRLKRNSFKLVSHTLGALYMMREPFTIASPDGTVAATVLEEPDAFLTENLPPPVLLRDWKARVAVYSASRIVAVKGTAGGCVEFSMTCVSNGRNAIKAALLSIETDAERKAVAERLRLAYDEGTFEDDREIYFRDND